MNVPFRPILSSLARNRTGALLVALQVAVALAVLVNAVYMVKQRVDRMSQPTGIDIENIFVVGVDGLVKEENYLPLMEEELRFLRSLPGVVAVTPTSSAPMSGSGSATDLYADVDRKNEMRLNYFEMDEHGLEALGLTLVDGRWFRADEMQPPSFSVFDRYTGPIVLTREFANRLFPDGHALGRSVYLDDDMPVPIVGIVDRMKGSWVWETLPQDVGVLARFPRGPYATYLVRTRPGELAATMKEVEARLNSINSTRALDYIRTLESLRARSYASDRNTSIVLTVVTTLILAICALGIFGLATFNVSTRIRQIGTRRAVGARRTDIVLHFLAENWLITTAGVVLGCVLGLAIGHLLSMQYQLPRVDLYYLVCGVIVLWFVGLAASWQPARRAARVSPSIATRTV